MHKIVVMLLLCAPVAFAQGDPVPRGHVPDEVAYPHLFSVLAPRPAGVETLEELAHRQEGFYRYIGLNPTQGAVLIDIADRYHTYMLGLKDQATREVGPVEDIVRRGITNREKAKLRSMAVNRKPFIRQLVFELYETLDDQGELILAKFMDEQMKPRIKFGRNASSR